MLRNLKNIICHHNKLPKKGPVIPRNYVNWTYVSISRVMSLVGVWIGGCLNAIFYEGWKISCQFNHSGPLSISNSNHLFTFEISPGVSHIFQPCLSANWVWNVSLKKVEIHRLPDTVFNAKFSVLCIILLISANLKLLLSFELYKKKYCQS